MTFAHFKTAVAAQFAAMSRDTLLRVDVDKDALWQHYLASFPDGSNPLYRVRTEHDCSCCRQFIKTVGNVVAVKDGKLVTIWDIGATAKVPKAYAMVAAAMADYVRSKPIKDYFLHYEKTAGTDRNFEELEAGRSKAWDHFFVNIPAKFVSPKASTPSRLGELRTKVETFARALNTISTSACDTVLELIAQNSLYRGAEHKFAVETFLVELMGHKSSGGNPVQLWERALKLPGSVTGIRNTSIGTLLVDMSEGMEIESAVKKFEAMVAPANYKRPTALVTASMVAKAKEKLQELGLLSALDRRYAVLSDITINDVLFADRNARKAMGADVFDQIATAKVDLKRFDKIEEVHIDKFLADILPKAQSIEVLVENRHAGNFASLIAPTDPTAQRLFKWDNGFSWSYSGGVTDAIKERVKAAGGSVTGELCCRLAWDNTDDLDLWMYEPTGGRVGFSTCLRHPSRNGGVLDLDANGRDGMRTDPAENIVYEKLSTMAEGLYKLKVNQYDRRNHDNNGFRAQVEFGGQVFTFSHEQALKLDTWLEIATIKYSRKDGLEIVTSLPMTTTSREVWGVKTQTFCPVNVITLSPNFWGEQATGNKHFFFMLDGCANPGEARGFYNEFLRSELDPHRKVFEMVGAKMPTAPATEQLSGLGFSSTVRNTLIARVKGSFNRDLKITF